MDSFPRIRFLHSFATRCRQCTYILHCILRPTCHNQPTVVGTERRASCWWWHFVLRGRLRQRRPNKIRKIPGSSRWWRPGVHSSPSCWVAERWIWRRWALICSPPRSFQPSWIRCASGWILPRSNQRMQWGQTGLQSEFRLGVRCCGDFLRRPRVCIAQQRSLCRPCWRPTSSYWTTQQP